MINRPLDTSPASWSEYHSILDRMDGAGRLNAAVELSDAVRELRLSGIGARFPDMTAEERVAQLVLEEYGITLPLTLTAFLRQVIEILDEVGVPYMLTGSLASAYYALPRATQDLDVVIATEEAGVEQIVRRLQDAEWYVDRDAALEAHRIQSQFNAIDPSSGWKVDFIIRKDRPYSKTEFDRRERVSFLDLEVSITSLEDILIAKLEWSRLGDSALQRQDALQLLERAWERLDRDYVEKWVLELGLTSEWNDARELVAEARNKTGSEEAS